MLKDELFNEIREQLSNGELRADHLILDLFRSAQFMRTTSDHIVRAERRRAIGNPPGKKDSLGDQITWELLLEFAPRNEDFCVISSDRDFASALFDGQPSFRLGEEWRQIKGANLRLFGSLKGFTREHFPHINLPSDVLKVDAISKLTQSNSFADTHYAIASLERVFDELSYEDAVVIFTAMIQNDQINQVSEDSDVQDFYTRLYSKFYDRTPKDLDDRLWDQAMYLTSIALQDYEDIP